MVYENTITFGGETLYFESVSPVKKQKTKKQKIGEKIVQLNILGYESNQWELIVNGYIVGTTGEMTTARSNLEALDDAEPHDYVDGLHNGKYIMQPESLSFNDTGVYGA